MTALLLDRVPGPRTWCLRTDLRATSVLRRRRRDAEGRRGAVTTRNEQGVSGTDRAVAQPGLPTILTSPVVPFPPSSAPSGIAVVPTVVPTTQGMPYSR